jgi:hypothetical protein
MSQGVQGEEGGTVEKRRNGEDGEKDGDNDGKEDLAAAKAPELLRNSKSVSRWCRRSGATLWMGRLEETDAYEDSCDQEEQENE